MCQDSSTTVVFLDILRVYSAYTWLQIRESSSRPLVGLSVRTVYYMFFPLTLLSMREFHMTLLPLDLYCIIYIFLESFQMTV